MHGSGPGTDRGERFYMRIHETVFIDRQSVRTFCPHFNMVFQYDSCRGVFRNSYGRAAAWQFSEFDARSDPDPRIQVGYCWSGHRDRHWKYSGSPFLSDLFLDEKIGFEHFDSRLFRSSLSCSPGLIWAQPVANVLSTLLVILLYIEETKKISQKSLAAASSAL